jgi:DNA-binding NtrC family response regulator
VIEIIRDHDGAMNVRSERGIGSRFEVWLPAAVGEDGAASTPADELALPLGRGETVLIIENERERLLRNEEMIAALGYEPIGFQCPDEAFEGYPVDRARFDAVVICDPSPDQGGVLLARALHRIEPRAPILLALTSMMDIVPGALADAGIAEILRYPLNTTEVALALARCLQSAGAFQR